MSRCLPALIVSKVSSCPCPVRIVSADSERALYSLWPKDLLLDMHNFTPSSPFPVPTEDVTVTSSPCPFGRMQRQSAERHIGKNHTVNLTITRSGNGTELPISLDLSTGMSKNQTWALEYIDLETYTNVTGDTNDPRRGGYVSSMGSGPTGARMLAAKTDLELYEERDLTEARRKNRGTSWVRGELPRGAVRGMLRKEGEDKWEVELELPM